MFESFYGLTDNPFRMSADEQFRYAHKAYVKAWSYFKYALEQGEGFVLITGRPGTGKTTLIRDTLSELDNEQTYALNLVSNQLQGEELLRLVALEFGFQAQDFNKATLLTRIEQQALSLREEGRRVVVIVDEAQNLSAHGLEELRLLSNLQIGNQPLFQICLVGQEELRSLIYGQGLENITQRIVASCRLEPMQVEQVQGYVEHRLTLVGWEQDPKFDPAIFQLLHRISHGVPREINLVMARLLLYGSLEKKHSLSSNDLLIVLEELVDERRLAFDQSLIVTELQVTAETEEAGIPEAAEVDQSEAETHSSERVAGDAQAELIQDEVADRHSDNAEAVSSRKTAEHEFHETVTLDESTDAAADTEPVLSEEDESLAADEPVGIQTLVTGQDEVVDELPPMPVTADDESRRPHGLLTDVDGLLDDRHDSNDGSGRVWRWFFYPVAIAALLIALVTHKSNNLDMVWNDFWKQAQTYFSFAGKNHLTMQTQAEDRLPPQADRGIADSGSTANTSDQASRSDSLASNSSAQLEPDEDPDKTRVTTTPLIIPREPQQVEWLVIDQASGELAADSRARFNELVERLQGEASLMVVLTGVFAADEAPLKQMRDALGKAEQLASLFVQAGVAKQRVVVEGMPVADRSRSDQVQVQLKSTLQGLPND